MKREFLKKLGIEDEVIDDIMREHGKTVNRKEIDLENATQERDTLRKTLKEREAELTTLEKQSADTSTLQADLSALKEKYEAETKAHEEAMQKLTLDAEIKLALADKVHDIDIVLGQVDRDALKFADGKLTGLDDQIKQLQADKAFLFKNPETPSTPQPKTGFSAMHSAVVTQSFHLPEPASKASSSSSKIMELKSINMAVKLDIKV